MSSNSNNIARQPGVTLAAALIAASLAGPAVANQASAQIGPARQIQGAPVASEAVHARFAWGAGGNRIVWVNQADEVYYHRMHTNRVDMHIRMRGHTVGHRGDPTEYVVPWGDNSLLVVTQRGNLYRHTLRREVVGPAEQIPGAPVATRGQEPLYMFRVGNRLINVTRSGEVWSHVISRTVAPPTRLGRVAIAAPRVVRHVFVIGRTAYIISDQGEIYAHDINPNLGRGRIVQSRYAAEFANQDTRFVFVMGNRLHIVNRQGTLWVRDVSRLVAGRRGVRGQWRAQQPAPTPAQ